MKRYFYRQTNQFVLDKTQLSSSAQRTENMNALYAAVYTEFFGASENPKYMKLTPFERINKLNEFAGQWLKDKGLQNE